MQVGGEEFSQVLLGDIEPLNMALSVKNPLMVKRLLIVVALVFILIAIATFAGVVSDAAPVSKPTAVAPIVSVSEPIVKSEPPHPGLLIASTVPSTVAPSPAKKVLAVVPRHIAVSVPHRALRAATHVVAAVKAGVAGVGGKWACIISRESGGNPGAINRSSMAGGLFQFLPSSWRAYGGTGNAWQASVAEQWRVALNAYARSGWSPWVAYDGC